MLPFNAELVARRGVSKQYDRVSGEENENKTGSLWIEDLNLESLPESLDPMVPADSLEMRDWNPRILS